MKLCDILTILIWGSWRDLLQNFKKVIKKIIEKIKKNCNVLDQGIPN